MYKKILFISGTRADYGKIKPLAKILDKYKKFRVSFAVTGMHLSKIHGYTYFQIKKDFKKNKIFKFDNFSESMDLSLSRSIKGFNRIISNFTPDVIIIHGDRVEALAASIVAHLNKILCCHIEGGEISGTVDDSMRHAISKMANIHFVSNEKARRVLIQLGEIKRNIYIIGSPEVDVMMGNDLPDLKIVKEKYNINFEKYAIICFHPDINEKKKILLKYINRIMEAVKNSKNNFLIIYPNNDLNFKTILSCYKKYKNTKNIRFIPSIRFEYYLSLLKNSLAIIGNSSSGVREAPVYKIKSINIGHRQNRRTNNPLIINFGLKNIPKSFDKIINKKIIYHTKYSFLFGDGKSKNKFFRVLNKKSFWNTPTVKDFNVIL
jgi:UDP-N-acetylglucosamine 2-epimerase (hydrolysing)